ncbi:MAG: beta-hydroxyacyl-ACP dehydratase [Myxococcales bacterium]|nr:beta-hydroxyacyl-ACP dehydratase [Myxococcales bacterium]
MRYYLLDRITELSPPERARGIKAVALSEDYLADHFPRYPTMPGALMLESLAQLSGVLLEKSAAMVNGAEIRAVLTTVERAKFRQLVRPGDVLLLESRVVQLREEGGRVTALARVGDRTAVTADLQFAFFQLDDDTVRAAHAQLLDYWLRGSSPAPAFGRGEG